MNVQPKHFVPEDAGDAKLCDALVDATLAKIAPAWPLASFVAVNPFLGRTAASFADTAREMALTAGARLTMDRAFYAAAIEKGEVTENDLDIALIEAPRRPDGVACAADLAAAAKTARAEARPTPLFTDAAGKVAGWDLSGEAVERISTFCASWFDEGQAVWGPDKSGTFFATWRADQIRDRSYDLMGAARLRRRLAELPDDAGLALRIVLKDLPLRTEEREAYLDRALQSVGGWAAFAKTRTWRGGEDPEDALRGILAARLAWDWAAHHAYDPVKSDDVRRALAADTGADDGALALDLILHDAYERAERRRLFEAAATPPAEPVGETKPAIQAAFCIDVRSEVFRRALETADSGVATIGFAGFFGAALAYETADGESAEPSCPVLLDPAFTATERAEGDAAAQDALVRNRAATRGFKAAWRRFKSGAVASFGFVESMGVASLLPMIQSSLPKPAAAENPETAGATPDWRGARGLPVDARADAAEGILRGLSLTEDFADLVVLAGHGGSSVNNPHAAGLHCGACGGRDGAANARVVADLLNDAEVRASLKKRGLAVPETTVFMGALHDTTTDRVTLFAPEDVSRETRVLIDRFARATEKAGAATRRERARALGLSRDDALDQAILARANDWSQVRPEWGLAGCAAFIAAPRATTTGRDLSGRAFLHSYDWRADEGFAVLETILTAPVVVASWISLQYFAATVDNAVFGGGDKTLHNVVGGVGVLEGAGGDLRVGLPLQSVHNGERYVHKPVRLNVMVDAPVEAINDVLKKHAGVRDLFDNGWLHLFTINAEGAATKRYRGDFDWENLVEESPALMAAE